MHHVFIFIDRRTDDFQDVRDELISLQHTVTGLTIRWDQDTETNDSHTYRDFAPIAELRHASEEALDIVVEELVDLFGWKVDCRNRGVS